MADDRTPNPKDDVAAPVGAPPEPEASERSLTGREVEIPKRSAGVRRRRGGAGAGRRALSAARVPRVDGTFHCAAEHAPRAACAQRIGVVNAVTARQCRGDEGHQLVAGVRPSRCLTEVDVGVRQLTQAEPAGERGREQQARVVDEAVVVEGDPGPVGAARC